MEKLEEKWLFIVVIQVRKLLIKLLLPDCKVTILEDW